jgi:aryl-phospho-beta-D-glucosidase BglC (GH1 family)
MFPRNRKIIKAILIIAVFSQAGFAFLKTQGTQIVDSTSTPIILRGYGLGGWLVPEGYMLHIPGYGSPTAIHDSIYSLIGEPYTNLFYDRYEANYVNKNDIDLIAQWGFNSIRLPFHFKVFYDTTTNNFIEEGFALLDTLLGWCEQNNLYLILDMHCAPGGQNKDNISDSDGIEARLWTEPTHNQALTIKIWTEIANRYVDDVRIAGFDLINEPVLPDGYSSTVLRDFYVQLTDSIRSVDSNHIIFIEGNWYATDFSSLAPPWDSNMAYSFHKYWNETTIGTIQYLLNLRAQYNVPLWMGESGENSNPWFYEAVQLFEQHNIGWCWWAHKKLETITSPLSAPISAGYQTLLDYWNGQIQKPTQGYAIAALYQMAEDLKLQNCKPRTGVIRALMDPNFGSVNESFVPLNIPGTINAVDYDYGTNTIGYFDKDYKNVGGNSYNQGYQYRNDGVDIEKSTDPNGFEYNVGWIDQGEWLKYTVNIATAGIYRAELRVASADLGGGLMRFILDNTPITNLITVPHTGGWQNWVYIQADSISLPVGSHELLFQSLGGVYNLNHINFFLTTTKIIEGNTLNPIQFELHQNFPNPFNPTTIFRYSIPKSGQVTFIIYNSLGQIMATLVDSEQNAGIYEIEWNAEEFSSGIYYYSLRTSEFVDTKKFILQK